MAFPDGWLLVEAGLIRKRDFPPFDEWVDDGVLFGQLDSQPTRIHVPKHIYQLPWFILLRELVCVWLVDDRQTSIVNVFQAGVPSRKIENNLEPASFLRDHSQMLCLILDSQTAPPPFPFPFFWPSFSFRKFDTRCSLKNASIHLRREATRGLGPWRLYPVTVKIRASARERWTWLKTRWKDICVLARLSVLYVLWMRREGGLDCSFATPTAESTIDRLSSRSSMVVGFIETVVVLVVVLRWSLLLSQKSSSETRRAIESNTERICLESQGQTAAHCDPGIQKNRLCTQLQFQCATNNIHIIIIHSCCGSGEGVGVDGDSVLFLIWIGEGWVVPALPNQSCLSLDSIFFTTTVKLNNWTIWYQSRHEARPSLCSDPAYQPYRNATN